MTYGEALMAHLLIFVVTLLLWTFNRLVFDGEESITSDKTKTMVMWCILPVINGFVFIVVLWVFMEELNDRIYKLVRRMFE